MRAARIAPYFVVGTLLAACGYVPPKEGSARYVSPDYTASGDVETARAWLYGSITLLEFDTNPMFLSVRDDTGASVSYERVGRYYRLPRALEKFTIWVNGRTSTFTAQTTTRVFSAPVAVTDNQTPVRIDRARRESAESTTEDKELRALVAVCEAQLAEARRLLDKATSDPKHTGQELFAVNQQLDEIAARVATAGAVTVRVGFQRSSTAFKTSAELADVLVAAGRAADQIDIRGRTDSNVAGTLDGKIARNRALAAQAFLVEHGVNADKITTSSQADGAFVVPNNSQEGRAVNRRVEIEFTNGRIADLHRRPIKLAAGSEE